MGFFQGEDEGSCGCVGTEHGCCPDGETPSEGPDFEGCSEYPGEICHLPKPEARPECQTTGTFEMRVHFDQDFGGCSNFFHVDCSDDEEEMEETAADLEGGGKANNFEDMLSCREHCETPSGSAR